MSKADINLDGYVDVPTRLRMFYDRHPDGVLQPRDPDLPYRIEELGDTTFLVYTACAYRHPDDPMPGIGVAWEQVPGRTPYTRGSELMNAETSAWGRAIGALGIGSTDRVATVEEVAGAQPDDTPDPPDLSRYEGLVADARTAGVTKADDEWAQLDAWASTSQAHADMACKRLEQLIAEVHPPDDGPQPDPAPDDEGWDVPAKTEADDPQPYDWRTHARDAGVKVVDVLKVIRSDWPDDSTWDKPNRTKDLDALAADDAMASIVQATIEDMKGDS